MEMRNAILGTIAGLAIGTVGALAYSHYLGDGKLLDDVQAQLDAANASLAKITKDKQQLAKGTTGASDEVDQLQASNADLKKQLDDLKNAEPAAPTNPAMNPAALARMMMGMMRGGNFGTQQRMFLLQNRLKLTPAQASAIKAAMEADAQKQRELGRAMFRGEKVDPQTAAAAHTLDQTLNAILSPDQQAAYKQVQADEQASRASTSATVQMNQVAPLLQLSDSQKDQVYTQLYQIQMAAPDPTSLMTNPNAASVITRQAQVTQDALAKVLTPDQMTLYQQEAASMPTFGGGRRGNGGNGGNGGGNAVTAAAPAAAPIAPAAAPLVAPAAPAASAATSADGTTNAATSTTATNGDSSTNNAAAATPSQ